MPKCGPDQRQYQLDASQPHYAATMQDMRYMTSSYHKLGEIEGQCRVYGFNALKVVRINTDVFLTHPRLFDSLHKQLSFSTSSPCRMHFPPPPPPPSIHLSVCFAQQFLSAKKKNLHPFSNVENVVQMFLIVIIKSKKWLCTPCPDLSYYYGHNG